MSPPSVDKYYLITENDLNTFIAKKTSKRVPSSSSDDRESERSPNNESQKQHSPERDILPLPTTLPPIFKLISELDNLNKSGNLTPEERWDKYESLMRRYFSLPRGQFLPLPSNSSAPGNDTINQVERDPLMDEFDTLARGLLHTSEHVPDINLHHFRKLILITLQILPKKSIDKGVALLSLLQKHNFKFTQNGELYDEVSELPIHGSSLIDLVHNLFSKKKGAPHGWEEFYSRILKANIPESIIEREVHSTSTKNIIRDIKKERLESVQAKKRKALAEREKRLREANRESRTWRTISPVKTRAQRSREARSGN